MIRKVGSEWEVLTEGKPRKSLGRYKTRKAALKRLRQVEYYKHQSAVTPGAPVRAFFQLATLTMQNGLVRIPIIKLGRYVYGGQKLTINGETIRQMIRNFVERGVEVPLSYEHAIEDPDVARGQPIPAAGWLKELEPAPDKDGVLWGWARFTDETVKLVQNDQYKYISPAWSTHYADRTTGKDQGAALTSIALTNRPFLDMPPITMSVVLPAADQTEQHPAQGDDTKEKKSMPIMKKVAVSPIADGDQKGSLLIQHEDIPSTANGKDQQFYADGAEVKKALSAIPPDADDDDDDDDDDDQTAPDADDDEGDDDDDETGTAGASAASRKLARKVCLLSGVAGAKKLSPAVVKAIAVKVGMAAGKAEVITLSAVPKDAKGRREYHRLMVPEGAVVDGAVMRAFIADHELDDAIRGGKILPAQRAKFEPIAHRDIELFRAMTEAMPKAVRFDQAGTVINGGRADGEVQLSETEKKVAAALGNDEAKVLEAKRAIAARGEEL